MNPFLLFKTIRDVSALIDHANALAGPDRRWSLAYGNRSFWLAAVAVAAQIALMVGVPFPVPVDLAADTIYGVISVVALVMAARERMRGKTKAVFSRKQAIDAIQEADALSASLRRAGAPVSNKQAD